MEKFANDAQYNDVVAAAKTFGIEYVGKKKTVLIELINAKIEAGEVPGQAQPVDQIEEAASENNETTEATAGETQPAQPAAQTQPGRRGRKPASTTPREPRVKKAKWFEDANADLPYTPGDIVEITGGEILIGRKAQMTRYSSKEKAIKCILIHPVKGTLQNCEITMDYWKIKKADDQSIPVAQTEDTQPIEETPVVEQPETPVAETNEGEGQVETPVEEREPALNPEAEAEVNEDENKEESLA